MARVFYASVLLGVALLYHYFLGPGPTPSERAMELAWWHPMGWAQQLQWEVLAPLQTITRDFEIARHKGYFEPRGLIPFGIFAGPVVLLAALGFRLFRSSVIRVLLSAVTLTLCAFSYYGWLDVQTWRDYSWRWPIALFVTSLYLSVFAFAPALVRAGATRPRALQALGLIAFTVPIYVLSTEVTGTNPSLEWNLSPWPVITLYGFLLFGLLFGVIHFAAGLGLVVRSRFSGRLGLALGVSSAVLVAAVLRAIPFEQTSAARLMLLASGAGGLVAFVGARRDDFRAAVPFLAAALIILVSVKAGQWQAEYFQAKARDEVAPQVIAALQKHREERGVYPPELSDLVPSFLPALPRPRVGWLHDPGEDFHYLEFGDSFLLEFSSVLWVECAYSPAYAEEDENEGKLPDVAASGEEDRMLKAAWSCERKPPRLW